MAEPDNDHHAHALIERFENGWIYISSVLVLIFFALVVYAVYVHGTQTAHTAERRAPDEILAQARFAEPGVVHLGGDRYNVYVVAQSFTFRPAEVRLPEGAQATFFVTSQDVIHGYMIKGTAVNFEILPGEIATFDYTFDRPGEYLVICNQYCGVGHQNMINTIVIEPRDVAPEEPPALVLQPPEPEDPVAEPDVDWREQGARVYQAQCSGCHQANGQGIPGAFPPLANHVPDILAAEGGREYLVLVTLYGLQGEIFVEGQGYDGVMPAFEQLSDEDVAAVLNSIAHQWDNEAGLPEGFEPYSPDFISDLREERLTPAEVLEQRRGLELE